ncbi:MAG: hydrogenase maturation nickel metallochaperone HypA [Bryobacteraceae bacterium]|jgi:hydrogenase nickel incorporation protein HypA/HybF
MHESGMIEELIEKVQSAALENGAVRVLSIGVAIGDLGMIEPDHLREHFEIASMGTLAQGAALRVRTCEEPFGLLLESMELET